MSQVEFHLKLGIFKSKSLLIPYEVVLYYLQVICRSWWNRWRETIGYACGALALSDARQHVVASNITIFYLMSVVCISYDWCLSSLWLSIVLLVAFLKLSHPKIFSFWRYSIRLMNKCFNKLQTSYEITPYFVSFRMPFSPSFLIWSLMPLLFLTFTCQFLQFVNLYLLSLP